MHGHQPLPRPNVRLLKRELRNAYLAFGAKIFLSVVFIILVDYLAVSMLLHAHLNPNVILFIALGIAAFLAVMLYPLFERFSRRRCHLVETICAVERTVTTPEPVKPPGSE
jgi:uncharacterized membrane protein